MIDFKVGKSCKLMVCFCKIDFASHIFVLWGTVHIIRFAGLQLDENQQMRDTPRAYRNKKQTERQCLTEHAHMYQI